VAHALSQFRPIRYGRIASVLATHDATKLARPDKSRMRQYIIKARDYHLQSSEFMN
jgi:hypothetical protein